MVLIKGVIDYGELEQWIVTIEEMFSEENLKIDEQLLVLRQIIQRISKRIEQQKMADAVANVPLGGLFKRIQKRGDEEWLTWINGAIRGSRFLILTVALRLVSAKPNTSKMGEGFEVKMLPLVMNYRVCHNWGNNKPFDCVSYSFFGV